MYQNLGSKEDYIKRVGLTTAPLLINNDGMQKRVICEFKGCDRLGRNKGKYKNITIYDRFCDKHHRLRYSKNSVRQHKDFRLLIDNKKCERCGWDKAYCDRHRKDPKKGYTRENVIVLCPNCHRLQSFKT